MSKPSMGKGIALLSVGLLISLGTFFSGSPIFLVAVGPIGVGIANIIGALRMSNLCPRCGFRGAQHQRHDGVVCRQMYRFRDNDAPGGIGTDACDCDFPAGEGVAWSGATRLPAQKEPGIPP